MYNKLFRNFIQVNEQTFQYTNTRKSILRNAIAMANHVGITRKICIRHGKNYLIFGFKYSWHLKKQIKSSKSTKKILQIKINNKNNILILMMKNGRYQRRSTTTAFSIVIMIIEL